jgi:hypothetical protein
VWVELIIVAPRCAQGEITGYLGIHRDITERKRAEEALSAAQRGSKTIRESMSDEFFALDREWRYTYVNERALATARRAVGRDITRPELFGMPVSSSSRSSSGPRSTTSFTARCASRGSRSSRRLRGNPALGGDPRLSDRARVDGLLP